MVSIDEFASKCDTVLKLEENTTKGLIYDTGIDCIKVFDDELVRKFHRSRRTKFPKRVDISEIFNKMIIEMDCKDMILKDCSQKECKSTIGLIFCPKCEIHTCMYHLTLWHHYDITNKKIVYYICPHCRKRLVF